MNQTMMWIYQLPMVNFRLPPKDSSKQESTSVNIVKLSVRVKKLWPNTIKRTIKFYTANCVTRLLTIKSPMLITSKVTVVPDKYAPNVENDLPMQVN